MTVRFIGESGIRCATCGLGVQFALQDVLARGNDKDYALAAIDTAHREGGHSFRAAK
jgi:hypothetical protein